MPRRCALGCSNNNITHQFPHPEKNPDQFKAWVHIAGGKLDSPADYELYRKKVICDVHFTDRDRNRNNRLNRLSVPSLHLSGKSNEVGSLEKVLLAPVFKQSSFATLKLGAKPDVCMTEKVIPIPESKNKGSLAVSKSTHTDGSVRNSFLEHNYCQRQKKAKNKKRIDYKQPELLVFNKLKTKRRLMNNLLLNVRRSLMRNQVLKRLANAKKMSADLLTQKIFELLCPHCEGTGLSPT